MLHVLDVARTLRRDSEIVQSELNKEELLATLKERLLAAAAAAGDTVTDAEVDEAIRIYFQNLHKYSDPPRSWRVFLAHLYVRRTLLAASAALCLLLVLGVWRLFLAEGAPFSAAARQRQEAARQEAAQAAAKRQAADEAARRESALHTARQTCTDRAAVLRSLTEEPAAVENIGRLEREAEAAFAARQTSQLERISQDLSTLEARLREEYEVLVVTGPGRRSGVERAFDDKSSGYYLIVEAHTSDGRVLPRDITSRETGQTRRVTAWGEQVPRGVYERIAADKGADGAVDERLFAVKRTGWLDEEVRLAGVDGRPLARGGRITDWDE